MKRKQAIKIARERIDWWIRWLGLRWWKLNVDYADVLVTEEINSSSHEISGDCDARWQYMTAHIRLNVSDLATMAEEQIENVVVHELMHCLLNEMREDGIKHEERVATMLTSAFIWVRDRAKEEVLGT